MGDGALGQGRDFNLHTVGYKGVVGVDRRHECCGACARQYRDIEFFGFGTKYGGKICACFQRQNVIPDMKPATVPEGGTHGKGTPTMTYHETHIKDLMDEVCPNGCPMMSDQLSNIYILVFVKQSI